MASHNHYTLIKVKLSTDSVAELMFTTVYRCLYWAVADSVTSNRQPSVQAISYINDRCMNLQHSFASLVKKSACVVWLPYIVIRDIVFFDKVSLNPSSKMLNILRHRWTRLRCQGLHCILKWRFQSNLLNEPGHYLSTLVLLFALILKHNCRTNRSADIARICIVVTRA